MDVIKQKRNLITVIVLLVIFNLATLFLLWFGNPSRQGMKFADEKSRNNEIKIQQLLKEELGFDNQQTKKYMQLREEHRRESIKLNKELNLIKKEMFDKILEDNKLTSLSDSLLNLALDKQSEIEKLTFNHFLSLKKLCSPEQQKNLQFLMHGILGPPPPEGKHDGPPKDEFGEGQPPPPPMRN